ncbi:MAG: hypothetical protein VB070_03870 [Clostridiaceae bacterium]|nr:hypothetical protein [Clostridiaceae bacterium]
MQTLRDTFWLWGQDAGTHHLPDNPFKLPGTNRMTPLEGAVYFDIPNICRVVYQGKPTIPYDQDAIVLDCLDRVVWSIADYGSMGRPDDGDADVREVIRQAKLHKNVVGTIMDDFFVSKEHWAKYPVAKLQTYKKELDKKTGRHLDLWVVIYTHNFEEAVIPYLAKCDVVSMWTWWAKDIVHLDENLARLKTLCPGKKIVAGCYMWDYGDCRPISPELMQMQLDRYYAWLKQGEIEGVIFCTSAIADIGLDAVYQTRDWIKKVGGEKR